MSSKRQAFRIDHPIIITFLIFAVIGFVFLAADVLKPLSLAILLSFALAPVARFLEHRGLPRFIAVTLTVVLTLGIVAAIGFQVGQQLTTLADHLDKKKLERNIQSKFHFLKTDEQTAIAKLSSVGTDLAKVFEESSRSPRAVPVSIVSPHSLTSEIKAAIGPYLEGLGVGVFVLILVLFILATRDDLRDRLVRLFGTRRISVTTKTMDEVGHRISRYLMMFATVNSTIGLIVGLGLWAIGVPLALLWGVLAALFRFIPYVGPAAAFALPLVFSVANFPGWNQPLMVIGLFGLIEVLANSFFEPVIYGKTTGVTALGLLVAAMFWTWLWGGLGLLLSTPLTVCLAVLGKYVPHLGFFAILLGEETPLTPDTRLYHRLLATDQDGATQIVEAALKQQPRHEVFDEILIPTLVRAERDHAHDDIDDREQAFIWCFVGEILDELEETPEVDLKTLTEASGSETQMAGQPAPAESRLVGVATNNRADALALRMLDLLLQSTPHRLKILTEYETPLRLAEQIVSDDPEIILVSHISPGGIASARYLVRRLRARFKDLPILAGHWGERGDSAEAAARMKETGATSFVTRVSDARDEVLKRMHTKEAAASTNAELPTSGPAAKPLAPGRISTASR